MSDAGRILVNEARDEVKGLTFCRPLGGGIEFGETAAAAVVREIREELGATVLNLRYIGTLENIFTYLGEPGHEIVLVFDGEFEDASLYEREFLEGRESDGELFKAVWRELSSFSATAPLVPEGLAKLLRESRHPAAV
jgi:8-oxo-dGTP pyrophosphatase MutT (NUDIX family)